MPRLEVIDGVYAGKQIDVVDELYIGRTADDYSDAAHLLCLPEGEVSRQHARILRRGREYVLQDLGSTNGTRLGGQQITANVLYPLADGAEIRVASTHLLFHTDPPESATFTAPAPSVEARPSARGDGRAPIRSRHGGLSVRVHEDEVRAPDVSMAIDASQLLMEIRDRLRPAEADLNQVLKRLQAMTQVSLALGALTDLDELLGRIIELIFDIFPTAQRAFIMLHDRDSGEYAPVAARGREGSLERDEQIAVSRTIVDEVVSKKQSILSLDALGDERFGARESIVALSIRSVMSAPLLIEDEVLGLIQLDNPSDSHAFDSEDLQVLTGICAQTAVALRNFQLYADIENLFEGFVKASVHAIEARDPITAGHSFRVAEFTERLARAVDRADSARLKPVTFDREQVRELRYAALLHDFGKVGVREHVLTKEKKLHGHEMAMLEQRFRYALVCLEREHYRRLVALQEEKALGPKALRVERERLEAEIAEEAERLEGFLEVVTRANEPTISRGGVTDGLLEISRYQFPERDGNLRPLLTEFEFSDLTLSKGSLTPKERREIEAHVSHSFAFLRLIPWTAALAGVPHIAHAHHEKLDGSGYPLGLSADEISIQTRILTIADIYDALTSGDRPYKGGLTTEQALDILADEGRAGKLDSELYEVFLASKAYER